MFKKILSSLVLSIFLAGLSANASNFGIDQNLNLSPDSESLDFGTIEIHQSKKLEFTFTNNGEVDRQIEVYSEPVVPFFTTQSRLTVTKNSSQTLEIEFRPNTPGKFKQIFKVKEITTNEIKSLTIEGEAENPHQTQTTDNTDNNSYNEEIYYYPEDELEFPDTNEDYSSEMYIAVTNHKDSRETIEMTDDANSPFDLISNSKLYLDENETGYFLIRFTPNNDRDYNNSVTLEDEDGEETIIDLKGKGINASKELDFQVSNTEINPDANQKSYFNFDLDHRSDIEITIEQDGEEIYSETDSNISTGRKNRRYNWDGDNDSNDQVEDGTYDYIVEIKDRTDDNTERFTGTIRINTDPETGDYAYRRVNGFPVYPSFSSTRPQDIDPKTTQESLIYRLKADPEYTRIKNKDIKISFETAEKGEATVRVYDENNTRKLTIIKDDELSAGYHKNKYTWEDSEFNNKDAKDGKYIIKVTFISDSGEIDTDVVFVNLNRNHDLDSNNFDPPYPNYDNTYQEYYEEFEDKFGYTPSCTIISDVPENSYTCAAAKFVFDQGIITGNYINEEVSLRPNDPLTRAEALTIILRVMGSELEEYDAHTDGNLGFSDLNSKGWYAPYVKTMIKTANTRNTKIGTRVPRILNGYSDGTLRPNNQITRAEFYKIFLEAANQSDNIRANYNLNYDLDYKPFIDVEESAWFSPYADFTKQYLQGTRFTSTYFNTYNLSSTDSFYPEARITRKEVMELLYETERLGLIQF